MDKGFQKGHTKKGGRGKGIPNKSTANARKAIGAFVDGNAHRLTEWLDAVAKTDPKEAFKLFQSVIEYHVPKLSRSEHTGLDGEAIKFDVSDTKAAAATYADMIKKK